MTEPKWADSQRAVEESLSRGPKTVQEIKDETGYSHTTVLKCLERAQTSTSITGWPRKHSLLSSYFEEDVKAPIPIRPPEVRYLQIVEPMPIPMEELGPRWQQNAKKLGEEVASIDLEVLSLKQAIKHLEIEAASILGALVVLKAVKDGPDWREQIGLTP